MNKRGVVSFCMRSIDEFLGCFECGTSAQIQYRYGEHGEYRASRIQAAASPDPGGTEEDNGENMYRNIQESERHADYKNQSRQRHGSSPTANVPSKRLKTAASPNYTLEEPAQLDEDDAKSWSTSTSSIGSRYSIDEAFLKYLMDHCRAAHDHMYAVIFSIMDKSEQTYRDLDALSRLKKGLGKIYYNMERIRANDTEMLSKIGNAADISLMFQAIETLCNLSLQVPLHGPYEDRDILEFAEQGMASFDGSVFIFNRSKSASSHIPEEQMPRKSASSSEAGQDKHEHAARDIPPARRGRPGKVFTSSNQRLCSSTQKQANSLILTNLIQISDVNQFERPKARHGRRDGSYKDITSKLKMVQRIPALPIETKEHQRCFDAKYQMTAEWVRDESLTGVGKHKDLYTGDGKKELTNFAHGTIKIPCMTEETMSTTYSDTVRTTDRSRGAKRRVAARDSLLDLAQDLIDDIDNY